MIALPFICPLCRVQHGGEHKCKGVAEPPLTEDDVRRIVREELDAQRNETKKQT